MLSLNALGFHGLRQRPGRSVLTGFGIGLGVAILFGELVLYATIQRSLDEGIRDYAGHAHVTAEPVGSSQARLPELVVSQLASLPDVERVTARLTIRTTVTAPSGASTVINVNRRIPPVLVGLDDEAASVFTLAVAAGRSYAPAEPEVVLAPSLADELGLRVGDRARFSTSTGFRDLAVVGVLEDRGLARENGGLAAFTSLPAVRSAASAGPEVSAVALVLRAGVEPQRWMSAHDGDLGPGLHFEEIAAGLDDLRQQIAAALAAFFVLSSVVLFAGAFLIHLTLSIAVVERTQLYGTLRAIGASRAQVMRLVVAEAIGLGLAGSVAGLVLGFGVATALLHLPLVGFATASSASATVRGAVVTTGPVIAAITLGVGASLLSSLLPAWRAARVDPVVAIRGDQPSRSALSRSWVVGAALFAGGVVASIGARSTSALSLVMLLLLVGAVLLVPPLLRPVAAVVGKVTRHFARGVGEIPVLHLVKERSRSSATLALVMVVLAMTFSSAAAYASAKAETDRQLTRILRSDLQLAAASSFSPDFMEQLRALPGVDRFTAYQHSSTSLSLPTGDERVQLVFIDPATWLDFTGVTWVDGDDATVKDALTQGGTIVMADALAHRLGLRRGSTVRVATTQGPKDFVVAGVTATVATTPHVLISQTDGRAFFNGGDPTDILVDVVPSTTAVSVRKAIEEQLGHRTAFVIDDGSGIRRDVASQVNSAMAGLLAVLLLVGIVGLVGLGNTLAISVLQRSREIGVLRAIGTHKSEVRAMAVVESATLALVALALALPLGSLMAAPLVRSIGAALNLTVGYVYPWAWILVVAGAAVVVALLAAVAPARRAARLNPIEALRFE